MTHPLALVARYFAQRAVRDAAATGGTGPHQHDLAESAFCADDAAFFAEQAAREGDWSELYSRTCDARHCAGDVRRKRVRFTRSGSVGS